MSEGETRAIKRPSAPAKAPPTIRFSQNWRALSQLMSEVSVTVRSPRRVARGVTGAGEGTTRAGGATSVVAPAKRDLAFSIEMSILDG